MQVRGSKGIPVEMTKESSNVETSPRKMWQWLGVEGRVGSGRNTREL